MKSNSEPFGYMSCDGIMSLNSFVMSAVALLKYVSESFRLATSGSTCFWHVLSSLRSGQTW